LLAPAAFVPPELALLDPSRTDAADPEPWNVSSVWLRVVPPHPIATDTPMPADHAATRDPPGAP
jgi:hypothetical protein